MHSQGIAVCSELFPGLPHEKQENRENLQTSGQHIENQDELDAAGEKRKIFGRSDQRETRTDVVEGRGNRGKVGDQIVVVERNQKNGQGEDHQIGDQENIGRADDLMFHQFAVHGDFTDRTRVQMLVELFADALEQDDKARNLDAAAGTARTRADEHQDDQNRTGQTRPPWQSRWS